MLETREPVGLALELDVGKINTDMTMNSSPKTRNSRRNGQAQTPSQVARKKGLAVTPLEIGRASCRERVSLNV